MKTTLTTLFCLGALGFFAYQFAVYRELPADAHHSDEFVFYPTLVTDGGFNPQQVVPPFAPILDAPFIAADKVTDEVLEGELILGLELNEESRAYPINMLTGPKREIINDHLGGMAIAATW